MKKTDAIAHAYERGDRPFAFDPESQLRKFDEHAQGATTFCWVLCDGTGADRPHRAPAIVADLVAVVRAHGVERALLDLDGGFPGRANLAWIERTSSVAPRAQVCRGRGQTLGGMTHAGCLPPVVHSVPWPARR